MKWITAHDLALWGQSYDSRSVLPELVRRLIRASTNGINYIRFPSGDDIQLHGWDGRLEATNGNAFVPIGLSVWEVSSQQTVTTKANDEYKNRSKKTLGDDPKSSTFIFVTPHEFPNRIEWCNQKKTEKKWNDIRIIDGPMLEDWISQCPSVGAWLANAINKLPPNVDSIDYFWKEWAKGPQYEIIPELIAAGRIQQIEDLRIRLEETPSLISIKSETQAESLAFAIAAISTFDPNFKEHIHATSLIVDDEQTFRLVSRNHQSLILLPRFQDFQICSSALVHNHHVIIPLGTDNTASLPNLIELPRLERFDFIEALIKMGFSQQEAETRSKECGRNITIFRRSLGFGVANSKWADLNYIRQVIPSVLAGAWDEHKRGDIEILVQLSGQPYDHFIKDLTVWKTISDPPIYQIGTKWKLSSPLDSWMQSAKYLTSADFDILRKVILKVLSEIHPMFELTPDKRHMASLHGKTKSYSSELRSGLVQSLMVIGIHGENFHLNLSSIPQVWVDSIVAETLKNPSSEKWCSLQDIMPDLAEASPNAFLDAVEQSLQDSSKPIIRMFNEDPGLFHAQSYHAGLLWALEGIAWMPEFLTRVTLVLGKLAKLDPGGKLANRPIRSLHMIFLPWLPQSNANVEQRFEAINTLVKREASIAWQTIIGLLPDFHGVSEPTHKMRWRTDCEYPKRITDREVWYSYSRLIDLTISLVDLSSSSSIIGLLDQINNLPPNDFNKVVDYLISKSDLIVQENYNVWNSIREKLSRHRSVPDAEWALPEFLLKKYDILSEKLKPSNSLDKLIWLFNVALPELPNRFEESYEQESEIVDNMRIEAYKLIESEMGYDGIMQLVNTASLPWTVGVTAGCIISDEEGVKKILSHLVSNNNNVLQFVQSFIRKKEQFEGFDWVLQNFKNLQQKGFSNPNLVKFLQPLTETPELWEFIDSIGEELANEYWKCCRAFVHDVPDNKKTVLIERLLKVKRPVTAFLVASHIAEKLQTSQIIEVLKKLATEKSDEPNKISYWEIEKLFEELDTRKDCPYEELINLEWQYLSILASYGNPRPPKNLHNELSTNSDFFNEVIRAIYKKSSSTEEENENPDESDRHLVELCYKLLDSWYTCPGTLKNGSIDNEHLQAWIDTAREQAKKDERVEVSDIHIGKILGRSSTHNNIWPQEAVCYAIDRLNVDEIKRGFIIAVQNKRGASTHGPFEGGGQERDLAQSFRQKVSAIRDRWPITASLLETVAVHYDEEAKYHDNRAREADLKY